MGMLPQNQQQDQTSMDHSHQHHRMNEPAIQIIAPQKSECTLWSLVQYECDLSPASIVCRPVYRILKKCKGRPTVEVTPLYDPVGNVLHS
ncbi:hypothetical protein BC939DRAFT_444477 [Gamsiella multidivaricata]|uniref:uncharacterized protein n=1 Tax=Gamsiella multidivaricata TaxID=101098 RepID=UPI00221E3C8B|nr:uncharacterized protein BC939DRAFT_444477 [Gamsiella multidivaricata]KAI7828078.1 hypothetical protein BC939DRAFT_444477 [Gamsiella multidivaricata]